MSKSRERQKKRRQRQEMVRRSGSNVSKRQILPEGSFQIPEINFPGGRWLWLIPLSLVIFVVVIIALAFINPPEIDAPPNAIWLDSSWSYSEPSNRNIRDLVDTLQDNNIGYLFIYTSSLKADNSWSGLVDERNRFTEVEDRLTELVEQIHNIAPNFDLYAWIEVTTTSSEGYRLDSAQAQNTIGNFSTRMIEEVGFDGILLDVKPIFEENDDFITLIRTVRADIGLDTPMAIVVPADLTPTDTDINLPAVIAPGTEWSAEYKQRVAIQPDILVITAYNSYLTNPVDYIEWVSYQVESFAEAMNEIETGAIILVGVPVYDENLPAHDVAIESLAGALDGVRRGVGRLDADEEMPLFSGVAIFADDALTDEEWRVYRQKWINQ